MGEDVPSIWDADDGSAARGYADAPYTHYREEVYPLFGELIAALGAAPRVLDVGAGPGHLAVEFHRAHPDCRGEFVLLDVGRAMLDIARERLEETGLEVSFLVRDFTRDGWARGLGGFEAVVSNNALFHLPPERLRGFYATACGLLADDGLLLNHQTFGRRDEQFAEALEQFPPALAYWREWSEQKRARAERCRRENEELLAAAEERQEAMREARGAGPAADELAYAGLHLPAARHLEEMRRAGFAAGCIWRKMDSAVLAGVKGHPFAEPTCKTVGPASSPDNARQDAPPASESGPAI
ncbi:MAG: class I SAM-dependent methyltransferase [Candidatus Brocadiia bacterium]